jgi:hypothetical protein
MSDRTSRVAFASLLAAAAVFVLASAALAEDQAAPAKPSRRVDVEAGAGVHWGTAKNTPLEDDFYANIGIAVPFGSRFDGEFQAGYLTGRDNDRNDADGEPEHEGRTGWYLGTGLRFYAVGDEDASTRYFVSAGPSVLFDYRQGDDATAAFTLTPIGFRLMLGKSSGLVLRMPIALMLESDAQPLFLPTLNYLYQF